nr:SAM-dependent methyltransferase [Chloroflexia bacterium]
MSAPAPLRDLLHGFAFDRLFNELGWDRFAVRPTVQVGEAWFDLSGAAQKRGFVVLVCAPDDHGRIPASDLRRRIDREVTKLHREHLLVFVDAARTEQVWMFAHRQQGEPTRLRERRWQAGQTGDPILQTLQGFAVSLAEDDALTLVDVTRRNRQAAAVEKVTRKFYAAYKQEHDAFRGFVQGIKEQGDRAWYASVMLNRLMFVYFIQKKGFLDGNPDYLRDKLRQTQEQRGPDQFITFYRHFLLRLFHHGLGARKHERRKGLDALLGDVPYLNGGLFDVHQLERVHASMDVPDEAFEKLFVFFDDYTWHLDERPGGDDAEINPDVIGYIFEKHINQKQMGAYYTKEDITGYIGQNTIIPAVFDQARTNPEFGCAVGFRPDGALWGMLREHPDHYLYGSVKHGTDLPLPPEIAAGDADVAQRDGWNRLAAAGFALPTETWREHIARRQRCTEVRARLAAGAVTSVDDLITLNLDIRQFAEDAIARAEGSDLVWAFYQALRGVTVLDPTCGSGAFLFAALNILRPLYDACLDRMQGFLDDLERAGQPHWPETLRHFREELARIERHPNRDAFVLKTIILNNLFGVDIMEEAVEICKLRLFLKQVAQVEDAADIEPLPDIDFNIRAGNTLVGFATLDQVKAAITGV